MNIREAPARALPLERKEHTRAETGFTPAAAPPRSTAPWPEHPPRKPFTPAAGTNKTVDGAHQEPDTGPESLATAAKTSILVGFIVSFR